MPVDIAAELFARRRDGCMGTARIAPESNNRSMFLSAPRRRSAAAGGLQATARLSGQTAGAVLMTVLFTLTAGDLAPRIGLFLAALLAVGAGLVSTRR